MQTIERAPSGHAGGSRSCAYADIVYTVATSADTSLDIVGQTHQALAALSISLKGHGHRQTLYVLRKKRSSTFFVIITV
ncbi:UNVERIFIED_CONTAM: hypothetical protein MKS84_20295 [Pseudomonas sp. JL1]